MKTRQVRLVLWLALGAGVALLALYAACRGGRYFTAARARALAARAAGVTKPEGERTLEGWGRRELTTAFADECWAKARADMLIAGAPTREVDGVLRAARAEAEHPHGWGARPFAVPSVVQRGHAGPSRVWAIRLQWEVPYPTLTRGAAALCHHRILVIDSKPPHPVLAAISCD